jgi:hypothetical protein
MLFNIFSILSRLRLACVGVCLSLTAVQACELPGTEIDPAKARRVVQKVKSLLQTIQGREKDTGAVFEIFADKFKDPEKCPKNALDIINPFWTRSYQRDLASWKKMTQAAQHGMTISFDPNSRGGRQRVSQQRVLDEKRKLLSQEAHLKRTYMLHIYQGFSKEVQRSKNVVAGLDQLVEACDDYLKGDGGLSMKHLRFITNSLLGSYLYGTRNVVKRYLVNSESEDALLSFKKEEINQYYTQDRRNLALSEMYYIQDYVRLIGIMMKLGLAMEHEDWKFADKLKLYIERKLTLDSPSEFLQDGYFYYKGLQKNEETATYDRIVGLLMQYTNTPSAFGTDFAEAVPLTQKEKKAARLEFLDFFQAHQNRVKDYIQNLTPQACKNIEASRVFLCESLEEKAFFSPALVGENEVKGLEDTPLTPVVSKKSPPKTRSKKSEKSGDLIQDDQKSQRSADDLETAPSLPKTTPETTITLARAVKIPEQIVAPTPSVPLLEPEKAVPAAVVHTPAPAPVAALPQKNTLPQKGEKSSRPASIPDAIKEKNDLDKRSALNTARAFGSHHKPLYHRIPACGQCHGQDWDYGTKVKKKR